MSWGRRRKERGTSGMAGWWLEARERASASRPWEHSLAAMAVHAPAESTENREGVGRQVRGVRAARHHHIASLGELANGHEHWRPRDSEVLRPVGHDKLQTFQLKELILLQNYD